MRPPTMPAAALLAALLFETAAAPAVAAVQAYAPDPAASRLEFTGTQAGAEFKGGFRKFTANIAFSPQALADSRFEVMIDLASEDTGDKDRDDTIRGPDIFDVAHAPTARYVTKSFTAGAGGYTATGSLTLRGVTREVPIAFKWTEAAGGATLTGSAELKRLDFGVGRGDWKSTEWVGDVVKIAFTLVLKPRAGS